jgi:hypothetical protein
LLILLILVETDWDYMCMLGWLGLWPIIYGVFLVYQKIWSMRWAPVANKRSLYLVYTRRGQPLLTRLQRKIRKLTREPQRLHAKHLLIFNFEHWQVSLRIRFLMVD